MILSWKIFFQHIWILRKYCYSLNGNCQKFIAVTLSALSFHWKQVLSLMNGYPSVIFILQLYFQLTVHWKFFNTIVSSRALGLVDFQSLLSNQSKARSKSFATSDPNIKDHILRGICEVLTITLLEHTLTTSKS